MMTSLDLLLQSIFSAYFSSSRCLVLITSDQPVMQLKPNIPALIISHLNHNNISIIDNLLFNYIGCQDFIINVKNPVTIFEHAEKKIKLHQDRFNKRRYVFTPTNYQQEDPLHMTESKSLKYVSDLLVIIPESRNELQTNQTYSLWTHAYIGKSDNNKFYMLDKWFSNNQTFLFNNSLFPDKLTNQQGRVLTAAVFTYEPYVIFEPISNDTYSYMGSEMLTLVSFAQHHNMTIKLVINELDYWGEIFENGSGTGLLGNLCDDKADIGAAALFTWESAYKHLELTNPTVRSGVTCLVPAPKLAAGWMTPVQVYSPQTWMAVTGTFVAILLVLYFLRILQVSTKADLDRSQNNQNKKTKLKIFGKVLIIVSKPFVMQTITEKEIVKGLLGRYLIGLVFLTALVLSTTYDSGLATIMTIPRFENPINTVDELVASGLYWGATQDAWVTSLRGATEPNLIKLVERFVATSEEQLQAFSLSGAFAYSVERLPNGNHAVGSYIQREVIQNFHLMTEDIYWVMAVMMLRKNSILLPYVDIFILRVFEAGLISFWQNEATTEYMDQYVQKVVTYLSHHQNERGIVKLKIMHVQGAFGILAFGSGIAFLTFLIELLYDALCRRIVRPE